MIVTTTPTIEGYEITEYLGIVMDNCYVPNDGDQELKKLAHNMGADAVVGVTFATSSDVSGYYVSTNVDYIALGTAVRIQKK